MTHLTYLHAGDFPFFTVLVVLVVWGLILGLLVAFVIFLVRLSRASNREDD